MRQIMRWVAPCRSAGVCLVVATLLYLAGCQTNPGVEPAERTRKDSTSVRLMDDELPEPPKKPNGPGCCQ
ncbi:hypothetical protein [Fibrella forsythiae]|uniref:Lipoprotein n=1 Tax=Fibrella forsythiae TaxID=2817061 RepID=A0ABS3JLN3_9BACT|nr:hypothetical protein [Fibrella forsythiae]MBO0950915.1 hypothetical protein [Fibrella forsythiae]